MSISSIGSLPQIAQIPRSLGLESMDNTQSSSFASFLTAALGNTTALQKQSEFMTKAFAAGQTDNIHEVMIASEKASIALQFTMQVRNKIMDAYSEIMRMQI